jgi:hypothetical protein
VSQEIRGKDGRTTIKEFRDDKGGRVSVVETERKVDYATYEATTGQRIRIQQLRRRAYNYALEQNRIAKSQGKKEPYDTLGILQGKYDDYILKHNGIPPRRDEVAPKVKTPPVPPPLKVEDKKGTSQPGGKAPPQGTKPQTKPQGTKTPAPAPKPKAPPTPSTPSTPSPGTKKSGDSTATKAVQTSPPQVNVTPPQAPTSPMAATPAYVGTGAKTTSNESIQELLLINTLIG